MKGWGMRNEEFFTTKYTKGHEGFFKPLRFLDDENPPLS
jgi:hypothetical protein